MRWPKAEPSGGLMGRYVTGQGLVLVGPGGVRFRDGVQQRLGIGMLGRPVNGFRVRHFHDFTEVHDRYAVGDVLDHRQVMGNEEVGELAFLLEFQQQVEHLGLDGYVQRGDGFVQNDEAGVQREGARDADALALAPGEFKGEAVNGAVRHSYAVQQATHPFPARGGCAHAVDGRRVPPQSGRWIGAG